MSVTFRVFIEEAIKGMEQGRFQDLCLALLPLYHERYAELSRLGHTVNGKTRIGTPDLLITHSDGSQTAVECSTEQDYWISTSNPMTSKPIADGEKCLKKLIKPREVVLISNREVPPSRPNAKAEIIEHFRDRGQFLVTILSCEQLSQFILNTLHEPSTQRLIKDFFPELSEIIQNTREAQKYRLASNISSGRSVDAKLLLDHISYAMKSFGSPEEAQSYVIQKLDEPLQFFRVRPIPQFSGITRATVEQLSFAMPLGKVWSLLGVPKIGKSSLVSQLAKRWSEWDLHWYDCPIEDESCSKTIYIDLISTICNISNASHLINSPKELANALSTLQEPSTPIVFIIDNAHLLDSAGSKRIAQLLILLKSCPVFNKVSIILVSNRSLPAFNIIIDETVIAPAWSQAELTTYLAQFKLPIDLSLTAYLEMLITFSGGHPLLAKALASKCRTPAELLLNQFKKTPSLSDETLAAEVESVLYLDILTDADSQNFVQRLSVIYDSATTELLDVLRREIEPSIPTPTITLLKKLYGVVLEGTPSSGYTVSFVFRQLAYERITDAERIQVCKQVARHLLWTKDKMKNAADAIRGIYYSILAQDFSFAFFWAHILLSWALSTDLSSDNLHIILSRLRLLTALVMPSDPQLQIEYSSVQALMAATYAKAGQHMEAAEILEGLKIPDPNSLGDSELKAAIASLCVLVAALRAGVAAVLESGNPVATICQIDIDDFHKASGIRITFLDMLSTLIPAYPLSDLDASFTRNMFAVISDNFRDDAEQSIKIALSIASRAKKDNLSIENIAPFFGSEPFAQLLKSAATGSLLLEQGHNSDSQPHIQNALDLASRLGLDHGAIWGHLNLLAADACYQIQQSDKAIGHYRITICSSREGSFEPGWAHWRLGLLLNDPEMLNRAVQFFNKEDIYKPLLARAKGALGAALILAGRHAEGVNCFYDLIEAYYQNKDDSVRAAAAIAQSCIVRFVSALRGKPLKEIESGRPDPDPLNFETVADDASPRYAPIWAFYNLSECYHLLNDSDRSKKCLDLALSFQPQSSFDINALPFAVVAKIEISDLEAGDQGLLEKCFSCLLQQATSEDLRPDLLIKFILMKADQNIHETSPERYSMILDDFEKAISLGPDSDVWSAELFIRRARFLRMQQARTNELSQLYRAALYRAKNAKNGSIVIEAGHYLAFEFHSDSELLKTKAEYQMSVIEGIEFDNLGYERLLVHGRNIFRFWSAIGIRRLYSSDLKTKTYLLDSSNDMSSAAIPESEAEIVMLVLLMLLFDHSGPALDFAKDRLPVERSHLPLSVLNLMRPVL